MTTIDNDLYVDPLTRDRLQLIAQEQGRTLADVFIEALNVGLDVLTTGTIPTPGNERLDDIQAALDQILTAIHQVGPHTIAVKWLLARWAVSANAGGPSQEEIVGELDQVGQEQWSAELAPFGIVAPPRFQAPPSQEPPTADDAQRPAAEGEPDAGR